MINYERLPVHVRYGMKRYMEERKRPGDFLTAVIQNKLVDAFSKADDINVLRMHDFVTFLYWEAPSTSWGSEEVMDAWCKSKREPQACMNTACEDWADEVTENCTKDGLEGDFRHSYFPHCENRIVS